MNRDERDFSPEIPLAGDITTQAPHQLETMTVKKVTVVSLAMSTYKLQKEVCQCH